MTGRYEPVVSVCMPVYRSERFIAESISSALSQTFDDFELIVIDDASPDATYEIASSFRDPRLSVYRNDQNLGPEGNWNRAMSMARGQYIKLLPGDDILYPGCLEYQVGILEDARNQNVVLVYCARDILDGDGRKAMRAKFPGQGRIKNKTLVRRTVRYGTNIIGEPGAVLFRADAAHRAGGFNASLGFVTDLDYWLRLLRQGDAYAQSEVLCAFRISGENWSVDIGRDRCRQFIDFLNNLGEQDKSLSRFDLLIGRGMAHVNEHLRRFAYRRLIGLSPEVLKGGRDVA